MMGSDLCEGAWRMNEDCRPQQEPDEPLADPADVLAGMADQGPLEIAEPDVSDAGSGDPLAALDDMAEAPQDAPAGLDRLEAPDEPPPPDPDMAAATGLSGRDAYRARRVRGLRIGAQQAHAHAHAFRRLAVPMCLAVAGLLLIVGALAAYLVLARGWDRQPGMVLVGLVSFPLAIALFIGAWWLHHDLQHRR